MRIDTGITSGPSQVLVFTVGNVQMRSWITVLFGQAKINHVDLVPALTDAHQKIVWLDVSVEKVFGMEELDA